MPQEIKINEVFNSWMGRFALLLISYWMGHIHQIVWELRPQIKACQNFRIYWVFAAHTNWERIRMYCTGSERLIYLSAFYKVHEAKLKLAEEKSKLEKELCNLKGQLSMLQCQRFILADQVHFPVDSRKSCYKGCRNYEPCCVGPPKMDWSQWRVLTKCDPLEKGRQTTSIFSPWESLGQYEKVQRYDTERWTP